MAKERLKAVPASYLVLMKDEKILLSKRFNTGYEDGKYSLPAGHVDTGESFTDCVVREANEEIGVFVNPKDLKVIHVLHRNSGEKEIGNRIDVFFIAEKWEGDIENKEPNKCDDLSWHDLNKLPDNIIPYIRQVLECINEKIFYSELGW